MAELLPSLQAAHLTQGVIDYLTTTFALADPEARVALDEFLADPEHGMFKGPYIRTRLPFRPADDDWRAHLSWDPGLVPYRHQAAAYARLTSIDLGPDKPRPLPTLVTTGTGSGKTEAFLHPILDHVLRANRAGVTGTKALILYPMNALANDQAKRLTELITSHPELASVSAGLYTGQKGEMRTRVSTRGLITDRSVIRSAPPDILLTNYKMLDQLLLREDDRDIWARSATSLTYVVLDEFHTYDGAQGTDVAMLLRRLGLALKSHWADDDPRITDEDRFRPLGRVTPVATSATLGDKGDPAAMLSFARTVFGEELTEDCVVTESRLGLDEWVGDAHAYVSELGLEPRRLRDLDTAGLEDLVGRCDEYEGDPARLAETMFGALYATADGGEAAALVARQAASNVDALLGLAAASPDVRDLVVLSERAVHRDELAAALLPAASRRGDDAAARAAVDHLVAAMSHVRAVCGRAAPTVELNLWIRELTRIDREASLTTAYRWADDGERSPADGAGAAVFPAIYCRHCGRSGWGVELEAVGMSLRQGDLEIRGRHAAREGRFRPLLTAVAEAARLADDGDSETAEGLAWLSVDSRRLLTEAPTEEAEDLREGRTIPVLTHTGSEADDRSRSDMCPSCLQDDGIRFLGSSIATLLSVSLSTLFGDEGLDSREKKSLVFTDSVQDAAHRAGFVESRSHTLTRRAMLYEALGDRARSLEELVEAVFTKAGSDPFRRYRMVPPDCTDREEFAGWWTSAEPEVGTRSSVRRRLLFDTTLEFGLQSGFGRTLERTGAVAVEVDTRSQARLLATGRAALGAHDGDRTLDLPGMTPSDDVVVAWARGFLEHIRQGGGIDHEWLARYIASDGRRWMIWGGRPRAEGMPAFPPGRSAPAFPRVGGQAPKDPIFVSATSSQSWYAVWTGRMLGVSSGHGARLARALLERLAHDGILVAHRTDSGGTVYAIPPSKVIVHPLSEEDLEQGRSLLVCDVCRGQETGPPQVVAQLDGCRCTAVRCPGRLRASPRVEDFYRRLYASSDMRRIVAREHSSLLHDDERIEYEEAFKSGGDDPAAPNVLVATPTLEMGIDIGDLSSVMLASLPRTVASYLQRVGRAGRLTGNALNVAFVTGRGEHLPKVYEPLSVINGEVRPPATYLDAEEILQRQYIASVVDAMARRGSGRMPRKAPEALGSAEPGSFLHDLVTEAETAADTYVAAFLGSFESLAPESVETLTAWATPETDPDGSVRHGTSGLARTVFEASQRWNALADHLGFRRREILESLPALEFAANGPAATDADRADYRSARAAFALVQRKQEDLRKAFWIAAMEEYGLLPNYTLIDDAVTLDVTVTWRDPETEAFMSEPRVFNRTAALALRDLAPGATFYARGLEMEVDGLDLGPGQSEVRSWVWCDVCGYATAPGDGAAAPSACPRCGSAQIADSAQRFDVVELKRVLSEVRRDESRIGDDRDDRKRMRFAIAVAADLDPAKVTRQWKAGDSGFGVSLYRSLDIRWLNGGRVAGTGMTARSVAGHALPNVMFRVCASCGKADSAADSNARDEHRAWCPQRKATSERTVSVALSRTLTTQAIVLWLPLEVTLGDSFAAPSLAAAILLGLRERIGGHPDHLEVALIPAPVPDGVQAEVRESLLLHDIVPGGTGYLTDLARPEEMWDLLTTALRVVSRCPCREEDRLACHRCLLPFSRGLGIDRLSRLSAERHLRSVLGLPALDEVQAAESGDPPSAMAWTVEEGPVGSTGAESHLELLFRKVFLERLKAVNATVHERPGPTGNVLAITLGDRHLWTLTPQQLVHGCKPDFVLRSQDPTVPPVAVFTDGWAFHASPAHNVIADDAAKRNALRAHGYAVVSITYEDLVDGGSPPELDWISPQVVSGLLAQPPGSPGTGFNNDALTVLKGGPLDFLIAWIQTPHQKARVALADAMWIFLGTDEGSTMPVRIGEKDPDRVAARMLAASTPKPPRGTPDGHWWSRGGVGVLTRIDATTQLPVESIVVLADDPAALARPDHPESWRRWLQLSNCLTESTRPWRMGSTSAGSPVPSVVAPPAPSDRSHVEELPEEWARLVAQSTESERELALALAAQAVPVPAQGIEVADGIPVDFAWPERRLAALLETDPDTVRDLEADGWTVVRGDVDSIVTALQRKERV